MRVQIDSMIKYHSRSTLKNQDRSRETTNNHRCSTWFSLFHRNDTWNLKKIKFLRICKTYTGRPNRPSHRFFTSRSSSVVSPRSSKWVPNLSTAMGWIRLTQSFVFFLIGKKEKRKRKQNICGCVWVRL